MKRIHIIGQKNSGKTTLIISGQEHQLDELDSRCTGCENDQAHEAASRAYDAYLAEFRLEATPRVSPSSPLMS